MGQLLSRVPAFARTAVPLGQSIPKDPTSIAQPFRDAAGQHAQHRNALFAQSQAAWHGGDRALAKDLSNQGKAEDAAMKLCNQQAAAALLRVNNEARGRSLDELDLHGLHVDEAIQAVQARVHPSCKACPLLR